MSNNKVILNGVVLIDLTSDTVTSNNLLEGITAHNKAGNTITGNIKNKGAVNGSINGLSTASYTIPEGYHNGSGKVNLTNDIEEALKKI